MDRVTFEAALTRDGFQIISITMKPEAVNPSHVHDFEARVLVVEGAMTIDRDGMPIDTFQAGESFEMPLGCRHTETAGPTGATYVAGRRRPS